MHFASTSKPCRIRCLGFTIICVPPQRSVQSSPLTSLPTRPTEYRLTTFSNSLSGRTGFFNFLFTRLWSRNTNNWHSRRVIVKKSRSSNGRRSCAFIRHVLHGSVNSMLSKRTFVCLFRFCSSGESPRGKFSAVTCMTNHQGLPKKSGCMPSSSAPARKAIVFCVVFFVECVLK